MTPFDLQDIINNHGSVAVTRNGWDAPIIRHPYDHPPAAFLAVVINPHSSKETVYEYKIDGTAVGQGGNQSIALFTPTPKIVQDCWIHWHNNGNIGLDLVKPNPIPPWMKAYQYVQVILQEGVYNDRWP